MRDDMRGVLGGMEKLRENVCEMRGAHMEVERLREQISLFECTGQTYKSGASAAMQGGATAEGAKQGNPNHHHHDEVGLKDVHTVAECSIRETQLHNMEADNAIHNLSSTEEGGGDDWFNETEATAGLSSPPCAQTRTIGEVDAIDDEETQYLYPCPSAPVHTPGSSRSMWAEFTSAVREMPAPVGIGLERGEGWVGTKRARQPIIEVAELRVATEGHADGIGPRALNLNLPPEKQTMTTGNRGISTVAAQDNSCGPSRGRGKGARGGRGRGRRPPPVQPRYHTAVSMRNKTPGPLNFYFQLRCVGVE